MNYDNNLQEPWMGEATVEFRSRGFSLIELLMTTAIFSILLAGVFGAYFSQLDNTTREYKFAEADVEMGIAKRFIEQDLSLSGYGIANSYVPFETMTNPADEFHPLPASVTNSTTASDDLFLMGTALGMENRGSQAWSYFLTATPTFRTWVDARESIKNQDRVILLEPSSQELLIETTGGSDEWLFVYNGTNLVGEVTGTVYSSPEIGTLIYGLYGGDEHDDTARPYYTVHYYLGDPDDTLDSCVEGTSSLLRAESINTETPVGGDPLLACVLDFQVAFGLDTDENGDIDIWDDGGANIAAGYTLDNLKKRLKRIKVFLLVQAGRRDSDYTYPSATVRVGEASPNLGRIVTLTAEQRKYRWRLVSLSVKPKNVR